MFHFLNIVCDVVFLRYCACLYALKRSLSHILVPGKAADIPLLKVDIYCIFSHNAT